MVSKNLCCFALEVETETTRLKPGGICILTQSLRPGGQVLLRINGTVSAASRLRLPPPIINRFAIPHVRLLSVLNGNC